MPTVFGQVLQVVQLAAAQPEKQSAQLTQTAHTKSINFILGTFLIDTRKYQANAVLLFGRLISGWLCFCDNGLAQLRVRLCGLR